jgi:hypothetical protein
VGKDLLFLAEAEGTQAGYFCGGVSFVLEETDVVADCELAVGGGRPIVGDLYAFVIEHGFPFRGQAA